MRKIVLNCFFCLLTMASAAAMADDGPPLSYRCDVPNQAGYLTGLRVGVVVNKYSAVQLTNSQGQSTGWLVNRLGLNDPIGVAMFHHETLAFAAGSCVSIECMDGWVSKVNIVDAYGNCTTIRPVG